MIALSAFIALGGAVVGAALAHVLIGSSPADIGFSIVAIVAECGRI